MCGPLCRASSFSDSAGCAGSVPSAINARSARRSNLPDGSVGIWPRPLPKAGDSHTKRLKQVLAMARGAAEQIFAAFGSAEIQMSRVLPGEADAAVDLYRLGSDAKKSLRAKDFGHRGHGRQVG